MGRKWADWIGGLDKFFKEKKLSFRYMIFFLVPLMNLLITQYPNIPEHYCSKTSSSERALAIGLGGLNLVGVLILGSMFKYGL